METPPTPNVDSQNDFWMLMKAFLMAIITYVSTYKLSGWQIHWISMALGTTFVFLLQKLYNYLWDKYIIKKKSDGKN